MQTPAFTPRPKTQETPTETPHSTALLHSFLELKIPRSLKHPYAQELQDEGGHFFKASLIVLLLALGTLIAITLLAGLTAYFGAQKKGFLHSFQPFFVLLGISTPLWGLCALFWQLGRRKISKLIEDGVEIDANVVDSEMKRFEKQIILVVTLHYTAPNGVSYQAEVDLPSIFHIFQKDETVRLLLHPQRPALFLTFTDKAPLTIGTARKSKA